MDLEGRVLRSIQKLKSTNEKIAFDIRNIDGEDVQKTVKKLGRNYVTVISTGTLVVKLKPIEG
jgi:hypothetical protein